MKKTSTIIAAAMAAMPLGASAQTLLTHIKGEVGGTATQTIVICRAEADDRTDKADTIACANGRFAYDLRTNGPEAMQAVAYDGHGRGRIAQFFAEGDTVAILFPASGNASWQSPSPLNAELKAIDRKAKSIVMPPLAERDSMVKKGRDLTPEGKAIVQRMLQARAEDNDSLARALWNESRELKKRGMFETPEYANLERRIAQAFNEAFQMKVDYARRHHGPVGLLCLYNASAQCRRGSEESGEIMEAFNDVYASKPSDFHLFAYMEAWCASQQIRVGGRFYDFTAPGLDGKLHNLAETIKGKWALIDLWASWCGPCRKASRSMIEVYEDYKDRGFTIVGVAREKDPNAMRNAIKRDKYPWLNLIELNDRGRIWQHYGVSHSGGSTFLVAPDGKIAAIRPTAGQVRAMLEAGIGGGKEGKKR